MKRIKKGEKIEEIEKAISDAFEVGFDVDLFFIMGSPNETADDVVATVRLAKKTKPDFISVAFYTLIPGNYLADYVNELGLSLIESYEEYANFSPSKPKIRGIDYVFLRKAADEILGVQFGNRLLGKITRFFYVHTKKHVVLRSFMINLYSLFVVWKRRYYRIKTKKSAE